MKQQLYSVYDTKAGAYLPPFVMHNDGMAVRSFTDAVETPEHMFNAHPEDYRLFNLGEWDDNSGVIKSDIKLVISAQEVAFKIKSRKALDESKFEDYPLNQSPINPGVPDRLETGAKSENKKLNSGQPCEGGEPINN